ncbi:type II/IV secretion system protein [Phragmitibacter flavus]|uniref:Type II/IV secretion system protein n=1 Tax=Phragmitibacter flavus TaxID=2576071 RepID=A0A5R8KIJ3_9BACT|nr:ATPase, T2SS/T4P/T4SS family [Phragmitibacter flavus]TLD72133.1 type II/IV secretion system protein [Phragmitibacter flavus]
MYSNEDFLLELLQENGLVSNQQLTHARGTMKPSETLIEGLIKSGVVTEEDVAQTMAVNSGMEFLDLAGRAVDPEMKTAVPEDVARRYKIAPLGFDYGRLQIAISDPNNFETLDALPHVLAAEIDFICSTPGAIRDLITQIYGSDGDMAGSLVKGMEAGSDQDAPIIRLVTGSLMEAFNARASDIHIEPMEKDLRFRYRIDGVLHDVGHHPKKLHSSVIARIKIMTGSMSIDEKRIPQDGRIQLKFQDKELDLRVSIVPTSNGESVVMRILDKSSLRLGLADLGFLSDDQETFEQLITLPDGIILVTGPTGSGKTTTLYACLNFINRPDRKIITVEDPVEYELPGINQVMVKEDIGMTFAAALRAMLRQAPNIIMLGEIRDMETASIAINASLTGHLVFSTLHTNDAPSAVSRLVDIGIKPFLIASSVRAIEAQRLVRKLCPDCKKDGLLTEKEMRQMGLDASQVYGAQIKVPEGCPKCRNNGFKGRLSIVEIFKIDDEVRGMINERLPAPVLRRRARELGMRTLREDGIRKVLAGMTAAEEVIEETMSDAH